MHGIVALILVLTWLAPSGGAAQPKPADEWLARAVDDRTFKTYLDFFGYDRHVPFELKVVDASEREGIRKEHLSFQSTPGVRVFANLYQSISSAARNAPALIFLHGAGIGGKDSRGSVLLSENPKRIGLFGSSRGAILGSIVGAVDHRLVAVVLLNGAHFDALERAHLPAACPANYIGRISPRPLLMLNGLYDQDHVKDTSVEPLYRLARPPKQILWSEAGHAPPSEENRAAMLQWLREHLK